jgi:hypothetical protein
MSIVEKILGQPRDRPSTTSEYEELDLAQYEDDLDERATDTTVHIAELRGNEGVMDVKDRVYDGDMVLADVSYLASSDVKQERIMEEFRKVADEVGGDIVQKGDDQVILTPTGVRISREKISR